MDIHVDIRHPTSSRQKFTQEEDEKLRSLIAELGTRAWKKVAARMGTRSTRQCRERYNNYLSPLVRNSPWTPEEDALLEEKVREMGQQWSKIVSFFNQRSDVNIKNRYAFLVSKGLAKPGVSFHPVNKKKMARPKSPQITSDQPKMDEQNELQTTCFKNLFVRDEIENDEWMYFGYNFEGDEIMNQQGLDQDNQIITQKKE